MYEHRNEPLLPRRQFLLRLAKHALIAAAVLIISLAMGTLGYHWLGELSWIDAFTDASMILSGMGPISALHRTAGKVFASLYAIYCGVVFLGVVGILVLPVFHRLLHHFHLDEDQ